MAAKKKSSAGNVVMVVAGLIGLYVAYRLIFGRRVSAATSGGYGGYGAGSAGAAYGNPYAYGYQTSNQNGLMSLLNKLLGFGSQKSSGGAKGNSGANNGSSSKSGASAANQSSFNQGVQWDQSGNALENVIESAWNDNSELGGDNLYNYTPDEATQSGLADYQIPLNDYNPADYDLPLFGYESPIEGISTPPDESYSTIDWGDSGGAPTESWSDYADVQYDTSAMQLDDSE